MPGPGPFGNVQQGPDFHFSGLELDASINVLIDGHPAHFGTPNAPPGVQAAGAVPVAMGRYGRRRASVVRPQASRCGVLAIAWRPPSSVSSPVAAQASTGRGHEGFS